MQALFFLRIQDLEDETVVQKVEAQVWLSLYNLLSKRQFSEKYELTDFRRSILLKLLKFANDRVADQLPFVASLKKWLLQIQVAGKNSSNSSSKKNNLLIETVAEIREELIQRCCGVQFECSSSTVL